MAAAKGTSVRLSEGMLAWLDEYAAKRGVTRTALIEKAIESFRQDAEAGVPELREMARRQASNSHAADRGVGVCPDRPEGFGHVWGSAKENRSRPCVFCGKPGVEFLKEAAAERSELFSRLRTPDSAKGIKPKEKAS